MTSPATHRTARPSPQVLDLSDSAWRELLASLRVDRSSVQTRTSTIWSRSLKGSTQQELTDLAIRCTDLTTLEAADTARRVQRLTARAVHPDPQDPSCPRVAAVCVWSDLASFARASLDALDAPHIQVAAVAGAFPSSRSTVEIKALEVASAVAAGASEIDIVLDRGAFLEGSYSHVAHELVALRHAAGDAHLKVILETADLGTLDEVRRASQMALVCGADFIKTSTGKASQGATPEVIAVMLQAVVDFRNASGELRGVKAAGGVRTAKDALRYLVLAHDIVGPEMLTPDLWRFGASTLLDDLCAQRFHQRTGRYEGPRYFPAS